MVPLCAEEGIKITDVLPGSTVTQLLAQGKLQRVSYKDKNAEALKFLPSIEISKKIPELSTTTKKDFFVETLYLYRKKSSANAIQGNADKIAMILRSISKLEGIQYYSTSRKKMRTLYEKSYVIDGPFSKNKIADPLSGSADGLSLFAYQKDLTFGENVYKYSYYQKENSVAFVSNNVSAMSYSFLKVISAEDLHVSLIVTDLDDYLLVYAVTSANFLAIPGIDGKLNASFTSRADAIYKWFIAEYEQ